MVISRVASQGSTHWYTFLKSWSQVMRVGSTLIPAFTPVSLGDVKAKMVWGNLVSLSLVEGGQHYQCRLERFPRIVQNYHLPLCRDKFR